MTSCSPHVSITLSHSDPPFQKGGAGGFRSAYCTFSVRVTNEVDHRFVLLLGKIGHLTRKFPP
ncbi:hypothetical protein MELA_00673 [Candidatus Methylomirabilis lanthanidiphila]|uniref:Uncharacterized protein n=1 Tax=Candidatus Methylomirabilis lanthanidiphila TaxID=2211376 RepID=A0A564ZI23_9BACT|nr:hypothetical protein MELA_00673 [Candidatus Methylomirabilis lanthanidiphila]